MNDFPCHAYRSGQADGDHARSRIDPDDAERLTGIYRSDGRTRVKRHRHSAATFVDVAMEATVAGKDADSCCGSALTNGPTR